MTRPEHDDGYADALRRLLRILRTQLGMQVAWVSDFVGTRQVFRYVDADAGVLAPLEGSSLPMSSSFCARVLDGRLPAVVPDVRTEPAVALLEVTEALRIGSYLGVPLRDADGLAVGMLCATSATPTPSITTRDVEAMRLMADLMRGLQLRALTEDDLRERRDDVQALMARVVAGEGRYPVLQPVVEITTGVVVVAEGLSRFTVDGRTPAQWFDEASRVGSREALELAAAGDLLDLLDGSLVPPEVGVAVNLGPTALLGPEVATLLAGRDLTRVVVEITEHAPVLDYAELRAALAPYRAAGLRLAVDDAGAGYASFLHVLALRPDYVKIDMGLVRGLHLDPARRALVGALVAFADEAGCQVVAEGVEAHEELEALRRLGVHYAQGFLLAAPSAAPAWSGFDLVAG